ncbi:MAG TPA: Uma2 family endonuclease [Kofleriaceae bacterium]|jgi:Uma2 family endonuclease|nr:Uma2 family endonuclease [Kofleriaceae bacterium]
MVQPARDPRDELYEAYLRVPDHQHAEIVRGTLYVMSRPAPKHASAASGLGAELFGPFQRGRGGPGGWWILDEPELQLIPKEPIVPDLAGWRIEHMPELPDTAYFALAPDWVCEVLSRSTERLDREEKLPQYAEHGVRHAWLLDPIDKRLEVYALDPRTRRWRQVRIYQGDTTVRAEPFEAIELDLGVLWSPPRIA